MNRPCLNCSLPSGPVEYLLESHDERREKGTQRWWSSGRDVGCWGRLLKTHHTYQDYLFSIKVKRGDDILVWCYGDCNTRWIDAFIRMLWIIFLAKAGSGYTVDSVSLRKEEETWESLTCLPVIEIPDPEHLDPQPGCLLCVLLRQWGNCARREFDLSLMSRSSAICDMSSTLSRPVDVSKVKLAQRPGNPVWFFSTFNIYWDRKGRILSARIFTSGHSPPLVDSCLTRASYLSPWGIHLP